MSTMTKLSVAMKSASIAARFGRLGTDCRGAVMPLFALTLPIIIGFAGLGTEVADWYLTKRTMQGAADAAAATAAASLAAGTTAASTLRTDARSIAALSNFVDGSNNTTVTVNYPPASGSYQGRSDAVEVSISRQEPTLLSSLFLSHGPTTSTRAVALANYTVTGEACVVALDTTNETSTTSSGTTNLQFAACSLYINSPNSAALNMNGGD